MQVGFRYLKPFTRRDEVTNEKKAKEKRYRKNYLKLLFRSLDNEDINALKACDDECLICFIFILCHLSEY